MLFNNVSSTADKNTVLVQVAPPALFSGKQAKFVVYSPLNSDGENSSKSSEGSANSKNEEGIKGEE